jgi:hypothetical protein
LPLRRESSQEEVVDAVVDKIVEGIRVEDVLRVREVVMVSYRSNRGMRMEASTHTIQVANVLDCKSFMSNTL